MCPHCHHEIDIFSKGGGERTAKQFEISFLGLIELDPDIRKGGDGGKPVVLAGESSPHAKSLFEFTKKVIFRVQEMKSSSSGTVIQVQ